LTIKAFFPRPADFRAPIERELAERRLVLLRLQTAATVASRERLATSPARKPMTQAQLAEHDDRMAAYWKSLGARPKPQGETLAHGDTGRLRPLSELLAGFTPVPLPMTGEAKPEE